MQNEQKMETRTMSASAACCGDPTANAGTGQCCTSPSPTCGCQSAPDKSTGLPVAIIGAGPIGLAAAVQLITKGETPIILEAGDAVGASIREWAHVRLFSPWKYLIDPTTRNMLERTGWTMPDADTLPTGGQLVEQLLEPIARLSQIAPHVRLSQRVVAITRRGFDKVKSTGREAAPFELVVEDATGRVSRILARAVIDASGTWRSPNPMGAGGVTADGESSLGDNVIYRVPDVRSYDRHRYSGKRVLVVGSGHSAFNALLDLAGLKTEEPSTQIIWAIRRNDIGQMFGGGEKDALEARGALGSRLQQLVESDVVHLEMGIRVARVIREEGGIIVETDEGNKLGPVDEIIVTTGFRPDLSLARELRLDLDPWLEAPTQLAPLIDPNVHSCGTVYPHGAAELSHPEKDFYVVGMKSYGRAPTFLLLTGYEQVRSIACALVGDEAGAKQVELVLPETGVCQTDIGGSSCCSVVESEPELVGLSHR